MAWGRPQRISIMTGGPTFMLRAIPPPAFCTATTMTARSARWPCRPDAHLMKAALACPEWEWRLEITTGTAGSISCGRTFRTRSRRFTGTTAMERSTIPASPRALASTENMWGSAPASSIMITTVGKKSFLPNGHVYAQIGDGKLHVSYKEPKILYRNLRNGRFEDISSKAGVSALPPQVGRGCAFGDFDNDGDVDIVINNLDGPPSLLRNDGGNRNNWLMVKCTGTRSNRSAIGTRVRVVAGGRSQIDEVMSGSGYYSQNDLRLHFGLGASKSVDLVEVTWPSGG